jgi:molybdate transport repressor ModE-like protein
MTDPRPRVVFVSDGNEVTHRQLEALKALHAKGSMQKAAASIGVSTPVLHKYVREIESKTDLRIVSTSSKGSTLTGAGRKLLRRFEAYERRLEDDNDLRIAGTPITERCVLTAATELSDQGRACRVVISTDEENLRLLEEMRVDCVLLDDAMLAMERAQEVEAEEIGTDMLLWKDAGMRFARTAFGAQRLGFRYLKEKDIPNEVARVIHEPTMLDRTDLSYFVNKSLVRNGIVRAEGARDQKWSLHSIVALKCTEHEDLPLFLEEASEAWIYRKG